MTAINVYDQKYDQHPLQAPTQRYVILSLERTGSTYLSRRLCNVTGRFGVPSEFLRPGAINLLAPRLFPGASLQNKVGFDQYLEAVERIRTTADGSFGIKVQPNHICNRAAWEQGGGLAFLKRFDRIIVLTRRDKLRQAVSTAIATASGTWHQYADDSDPDLKGVDIAALFPDVARRLSQYIDEEALVVAASQAIDRPVLHLEYEEIERDGDLAFAKSVEFLTDGVNTAMQEDPNFMPLPRKPRGNLATQISNRFIEYLCASNASPG